MVASKATTPYSCLGPEGTAISRRLMFAASGGEAPGGVATADLLATFSALSDSTWQVLSPLVGNKGVAAVMGRSVRLAQARHPFLTQLAITPEGLSFTALQTDQSLSATVIYDGLSDLFCTAMNLLCALIGIDIVQPMLERMERPREGRE